MNKTKTFAIVMAFGAMLLTSCNLIGLMGYDPETGNNSLRQPAVAVQVKNESFTLRWKEFGDATNVNVYRVYYREHGTALWHPISEISVGEVLELTIDTTMMDYGTWDFGIIPIYDSGETGDMHTSLDADAKPATGWYLDWQSA